MSLHLVHWASRVLGKQTTAQVIYQDSRIENHVAAFPMIVVMPDGYLGFYTDNEQGPAYARHIGEELPAVIERTFQARTDRAGRAIGGLSMGGYGALRIGLGQATASARSTAIPARWTRQRPYCTADRGRNGTLVCPAPPSEPDLRISRIRLSS